MKNYILKTIKNISMLSILLVVSVSNAQVPYEIPYEGTLEDGGEPAHGNYDFSFKLYNAEFGGNEVWAGTKANVLVTSGRFSVVLGEDIAVPEHAFRGELYVAISVRKTGTTGWNALTGRQRIVPTSFAVRSRETDAVPPGMIMPYYGDTAPSGWMNANGQVISYGCTLAAATTSCHPKFESLVKHLRLIRPSLANGLNSTSAKTPDLRGIFLRGQDQGSNKNPDKGDDSIGRLQADSYKSHTHSMNSNGTHDHDVVVKNFGGGIASSVVKWDASSDGGDSTTTVEAAPAAGSVSMKIGTDNSGSHIHSLLDSGGNETRPDNVTILYVIKY